MTFEQNPTNTGRAGQRTEPAVTCDLSPPGAADEVVEVLDGYLAALKAGQAPDRQALLREHPHLATQLEACLAGLEFIHRAATPADVPARLGDYAILREVGRGGMGAVYEATQVSLGRRVALKVLRFGPVSDREAVERFQREAETVAGLHHTNIVPIFTVGSEGGVNYYAMQFIDGRSLAEVLVQSQSAKKPLDPRDVARWGLQAAEALAHAHQRGVIHRDVKPSNLLLDAEDRVWLTDFGLARRQDDVTLSMTGALMGTPRYMSPEQAGSTARRIDHRTDIYSLGATLYELAVGRPAFTADTPHGVISQILSVEPAAPRLVRPDLHRDLETILLKCLSKDAARRYESAADLADDLRAYLDGRAIRARRASLPERAARWVRQQRHSVGLSAAVMAVTLVVGLVTVAAVVGYSRWRTAYLKLATDRPGLVANVFAADQSPTDHAGPVVTQTIPTQTALELPAGEYRVHVTGDGRLSQEYLIGLEREQPTEAHLGLDDQLLWQALELPRSHALVDFADGTDVLTMDESGVSRYDGASGLRQWTTNLAAPVDPVAAGVTGLNWPWDNGQGTMQGGHDKFDTRPNFTRQAIDLNNDGTGDVLIAARHQAWLAAVSGTDGGLLWLADRRSEEQRALDAESWRVRNASTVAHQPLVVDDLDADGTPDLLTVFGVLSADEATASRWIEALSGRTGATIWRHEFPADRFDAVAGGVVPYEFRWFVGGSAGSTSGGGSTGFGGWYVKRDGHPHVERTGAHKYLPDAPRTMTIDARKTVVLPVASRLLGLDGTTGEVIFEDDLGIVPGRRAAWGDVDGDGAEDLAVIEDHGSGPYVAPIVWSVRLVVWSPARRAKLWEKTLVADWPRRPAWSVPAPEWPVLADLNADGRAEVLAPIDSSKVLPMSVGHHAAPWGELAAFDGSSGDEQWRARIRSLDQQSDYFTVGPDTNGDGWREVFVASLWGRRPDLFVEAVSGRDGVGLWWNRHALSNDEQRLPGWWLAPPRWQSVGAGTMPRLLATALGGDFDQGRAATCVFDSRDGRLAGVGPGMPPPLPADANGDGVDELFALRSNNERGGQLVVIGGTLGHEWRRYQDKLTAVGDLDGDGVSDLAPAETDGRWATYSGATGQILWRAPEGLSEHFASQIAWSAARRPGDVVVRTTSSEPHDLDGDGTRDALVYVNRGMAAPQSPLTALSGRTGRQLWTARFEVGNVEQVFSREVVDLDGDGRPEVVIVAALDLDYPRDGSLGMSSNNHQLWAIVLSGHDGQVRWKTPLGTTWSAQAGQLCPYRVEAAPGMWGLADFDRDGVLDVLAPAEAAADGTQWEWRALSGRDGSTLWRHALAPNAGNVYDGLIDTVPPLIADLDGDGRAEVVVLEFIDGVAEADGKRVARVRALSANGETRWTWQVPVVLDCGRIGAQATKALRRPVPWLLRGGDGEPSIAIGLWIETPDRADRMTSCAVFVLSARGEEKLRHIVPADEYYFRLAAADLTGDGVDELLVSTNGEVVAIDPAIPEPPLWRRRIGSFGQAVEFRSIWPATADQSAVVAASGTMGANDVFGLDGATGQPRWICPGPNPRQGTSVTTLDEVAILDNGGEQPPWVFFRYGPNAIGRRAAWSPSHLAQAEPPARQSDSIEEPAAEAAYPRPKDPRYLRPLPWPTLAHERVDWRQLTALAAWNVMYSLTLIVLPGGMAWWMIARRQWGLWTLLALPAVVAVAVLALTARPPERITWDTKFGVGLLTFPALLLLALVIRWTMQLRWRRLALWSLLWIGLTLAAMTAAFKFEATIQQGPLQPGESYATEGWTAILLIGAYMTGCLAVVIVPLESLARAIWRWSAARRARSAPAAEAASVGDSPLVNAAIIETTAIPTGSPFSPQALDPR